MNTLIKKFLGFSVGPVLGAVISFITIPITTYFILPDEFGKASMFSIFQVLIIVLLYLGLDQAYTREYHEVVDKVYLLKTAMILPLVLVLLIFIIICFNLGIVSEYLFDSSKYTLAAFLFGLTLIFMVIERFIMLSIRMEEKALEYSVVSIILKLSVLILTLIFIFLVRKDFLAVIYSNVFGQIVTDSYLIIRYRKHLNYLTFNFDKKLLTKLLKFGFPLILSTALNYLLQSFDRMALRAWSNFFEIGIFTAALKISSTLTIIQTSFTSFWVPTAYRWYSQKKHIRHFELVSNVVLLIMSLLFCIIVLFKDFIVILLGKEYADTKSIIGLLCLFPIMYTLSETTTLGITFSRKSYYNVWVGLLTVVPIIIINYLLIPKFGSVGAAVATGASSIVFFLSRSYFSKKNWNGFPLNHQILISLILFLLSLINTQSFKYITLINIVLFIFVVIIQLPTFIKIISIYRRDNNIWDFS